jgi:hypothetical protein
MLAQEVRSGSQSLKGVMGDWISMGQGSRVVQRCRSRRYEKTLSMRTPQRRESSTETQLHGCVTNSLLLCLDLVHGGH